MNFTILHNTYHFSYKKFQFFFLILNFKKRTYKFDGARQRGRLDDPQRSRLFFLFSCGGEKCQSR